MEDEIIELTNDQVSDSDKVEDDAILDDTPVVIQYDITSYGADLDVEGLVKRINRKDILIPPFQRNYVWKIKEASKFIESLLLGLPVPAVFFAKQKNSNKLLVIDGQQRLKTLQFFLGGFFKPDETKDKKEVFKLKNVIPKFENRTYESLDENDRIRLNDSVIHAIIVQQESPIDDDTSIYHIFDRLNSTGRRLMPQEIRTAIYHGNLIESVRELNNIPEWRAIFGKRSERLKDQELILRFIALYCASLDSTSKEKFQSYSKPMNEFINRYCEKNKESEISDTKDIFQKTIKLIHDSLGNKAFRIGNAINAAIFDSITVGLALAISEGKNFTNKEVVDAYEKITHDEDNYVKYVTSSTSDETSVNKRISRAKEVFSSK